MKGKNFLDKLFISIFFLTLFVPFLLAHREEARISEMENRTLTNPPHIFNQEGNFNWSYSSDFDSWINDNVRFRTILMEMNSTLQYQLFGKIANDNLREGLDGHLFYIEDKKVSGHQHTNLLREEELQRYLSAMQRLSTRLSEQGITFYYMQCYDKDSIYPEYYVEGVRQFGDISRAKQIVEGLRNDTNVNVIPTYEALLEHKDQEMLYFKATDPAHWNDSGAYIGYMSLMNAIQKDFPDVPYLQESDYDIVKVKELANIYGFTYPYPETNYYYHIKDTKAITLTLDELDSAKIIKYRDYGHYYKNPDSCNQRRILLIGDSFIRQFIKNDIAESFYETLSIDWINLSNLNQVLEIYKPDIIVLESAEFCLDNTIPLVTELSCF